MRERPGKILIGDLEFEIEKAEFQGYISVANDDGRTNHADASRSELRWEIEVVGAERAFDDPETGERLYEVEPHFIDQDMPTVLRDWTTLAGQEFRFEAAKAAPGDQTWPSLHIGGGDVLPTSLIRIGRRDGDSFALDWTGTCYPMIDEGPPVQPFSISGSLRFAGVTVGFNDVDEDWAAYAASALKPYLNVKNLSFAEARKPYEQSGSDELVRFVHARFEPKDAP